jgi:hypothetical protein
MREDNPKHNQNTLPLYQFFHCEPDTSSAASKYLPPKRAFLGWFLQALSALPNISFRVVPIFSRMLLGIWSTSRIGIGLYTNMIWADIDLALVTWLGFTPSSDL